MGKLPSEILDAAADLITPEGAWTQDDYEDRPGCFCMVGAVLRVQGKTFGTEDDDPVSRLLAKVMFGTEEVYLIPRWNDEAERTQSEVIQALRTAAEKAREAGQ